MVPPPRRRIVPPAVDKSRRVALIVFGSVRDPARVPERQGKATLRTGEMRYPAADGLSSHEYELKRLFLDGDGPVTAVVFYLQAGKPVAISIEKVLKKTGLWAPATKADPSRTYHIIFEVAPPSNDPSGMTEVYVSRLTANLKEEGARDDE